MEAQRPIDSSARVRLAPAATRMLGPDLFVNVGGATAPVKRLMGSGPALWWAFSQGVTIAEVVARQEERTGVERGDVEARVLRFAAELVEANLAEITW